MADGPAPAATVRLPATARALIRDLDQQFPGLEFQPCGETGNLRPFVNIFLDNDSVRLLEGLDTPVRDGDKSTLPSDFGFPMALEPHEPDTLHVGTNTGQLFASRDRGDSWRLIADFLPPIYSVTAAVL